MPSIVRESILSGNMSFQHYNQKRKSFTKILTRRQLYNDNPKKSHLKNDRKSQMVSKETKNNRKKNIRNEILTSLTNSYYYV